jgi:hypothetical protein
MEKFITKQDEIDEPMIMVEEEVVPHVEPEPEPTEEEPTPPEPLPKERKIKPSLIEGKW